MFHKTMKYYLLNIIFLELERTQSQIDHPQLTPTPIASLEIPKNHPQIKEFTRVTEFIESCSTHSTVY